MFDFFRKRREQREAREAKGVVFKNVLTELEQGRGNLLEGAIVLHSVQNNQDSISRLIVTFGSSEVFTIKKGAKRLGDVVTTQASDGNTYIATYSSQERAAAELAKAPMFDRCQKTAALEIVYALDPGAGIVVNPNNEHLSWTFSPEQVEDLRKLYEQGFQYETGGIYLVWSDTGYRCAKLLKADDGGVHVRLYANTWPERPSTVDPGTLTLETTDPRPSSAIGHLPLSRRSFLAMGPKLAASTAVQPGELDGYNLWHEARGGYFGS